MKSLIIIPAFNEEKNIERVVKKISKDCPKADILVVDDCSKDHTAEILSAMKVNYVSLPFNLGIGGAVQTGYRYAKENKYDIAVQIDADGQHDSQYLNEMIKMIEMGKADIVIGSRFIDKEGFQSTMIRRAGIVVLSVLVKLLCSKKVNDITSGYRAVNRKFIEIYAEDYPIDYPEPEAVVMAAMHGAAIIENAVIMKERQGGESSITFSRSIYYMIKVSLACVLRRFSMKKGE